MGYFFMRTQWQRTLLTLHRNIKEMSGWERLWTRAWCLLIEDAIDGPQSGDPGSDIEGRFESRLTAHKRVAECHDDLVLRCDMIGLDAEAVAGYFRNGYIERSQIEGVFRSVKPD